MNRAGGISKGYQHHGACRRWRKRGLYTVLGEGTQSLLAGAMTAEEFYREHRGGMEIDSPLCV